MAAKENVYPVLSIELIKSPNRLYAIPLFGFIIKAVILIPVSIELFVLSLVYVIFAIINAFVMLSTGKYWERAYEFFLKFMRLLAKYEFFMIGLTDSYPGFNFELQRGMTLDIAKPANPKRLFAFPILGLLVRGVLLIPFFVWMQILQYASSIAVALSSFVVLFKGRYPESAYELAIDQVRVGLSTLSYASGLSDSYPSFAISMHHKNIKIALIIAGIILALGNFKNSFAGTNNIQYNHAGSIPQSNYHYKMPQK